MPSLRCLTRRPGNPAEEATEVTVRFHPDGDGTRVELEHVGWERHARPQQAAEDYSQGWPIVLGAFADGVAAG